MSFLINQSIRTLSAINRPSRLHITQHIQCRLFSDKSDETPTVPESNSQTDNVVDKEKLSGFARAFEKYTKPQEGVKPVIENLTFIRLLRESKFVDVSSMDHRPMH